MSGWTRKVGSTVPGPRVIRISGMRIKGGQGSCRRQEESCGGREGESMFGQTCA